MRKELDERCRAANFCPEWDDVLRDLDRLQQASLENDGKHWLVRTQADGCAAALLQAVGVAPPPRIRATPPPHPPCPNARGRPPRSATRPDFSGFRRQIRCLAPHGSNRGRFPGGEVAPAGVV
jgi:hypothetical protein